jgi:hypothetical protein
VPSSPAVSPVDDLLDGVRTRIVDDANDSIEPEHVASVCASLRICSIYHQNAPRSTS